MYVYMYIYTNNTNHTNNDHDNNTNASHTCIYIYIYGERERDTSYYPCVELSLQQFNVTAQDLIVNISVSKLYLKGMKVYIELLNIQLRYSVPNPILQEHPKTIEKGFLNIKILENKVTKLALSLSLYTYMYIYIYIYAHIAVYVCVCA